MSLIIHPLRFGDVETDSSFTVRGSTPDVRITIPVTGYLVLGNQVPLLVDAGKRVEHGYQTSGIHTFTQTAEQRLGAVLAMHGLQPSDIGLLALTHLHGDHTGYVDALPLARIALQRSELRYAAAPPPPTRMFDREDVSRLVGPLFDRIDFLEGDRDLAPGVRAVWTGGHTPGHQQIEVQLDSGLAVITGDNAYLADPSVTQQRPPGSVTDLEQTMRALARIKRDAQHVLPMHDPAVYERYPHGVR